MRKRLLFILLAFVSGGALLSAQDHEWAKQDMMQDPNRWGGTFCLYPEGQPLPSPAPKGYKPFYISHMGRHGARFLDGRNFYQRMYELWKGADERGELTPEGKKFYEAYCEVYPKLRYHEGILTQKGQGQLRQIADQIYRNYPALFKGQTRAEILSTDSHRVIISMMCLMDELNDLDRDLVFHVDYGRPYFSVLIPESPASPTFVPLKPFPEATMEKFHKFSSEVFDEDAFLARWFTATDKLGWEREDFMYELMTMIADFCNLDFPVPDVLTQMYTPEEQYAVWRVQNYSDYLYTGVPTEVDQQRFLEMSVTAKDIIDKFEEDRANGVALRMRFSHDTALAPLISYLGVNGMDADIEDPYEVEKVWRSYDVPMACNFQIVFFKSKKKPDDILIQVLLNGFQATLPLPEAAPGFYHWSDFKARFDKIVVNN